MRSFAFGKGTDKDSNVALFYSKTDTSTPSVAMNLGAEIGGKVAFYPGYKDVSNLLGRGITFTVSAGVGKVVGVPISAGASLEASADEKIVGFGLQLSTGVALFPVSWSMEVTKTKAIIFGKAGYD